jgi:hypothetical protein
MKHDQGQFHEHPLPEGERVIWQGRPSFKGLALRSFHIREAGVLLGLFAIWKFSSVSSQGHSVHDAAIAASWVVAPGLGGVALLALLAWLFRRATNYTITSKRIVLQFGVALPMTMNIPLGKVGNAALKRFGDGSGNLSLQLIDSDRVSYVLLWPHIRGWRLRAPEPTMKSVPDATDVAAKLAEALAAQSGGSAVRRDVAGADLAKAGASSGSMPNSPSPAAA